MHTKRRSIGIMPTLVQLVLLVLYSTLCYGQYQPQYYPGHYFPSIPQSDRRYAQVLYNTFAPTNNHEKRQAPAVLGHNAMPATANMVEQDPVATSQSMSFVVRDPGLQHQDVVNFLTSDKRLSQQPTPDPKSNTYMYEFWQNTQLPVIHWMPLSGNKPTAGIPPQTNSEKPLPPKAKLNNKQPIRPVSPVVPPTTSTVTLPATLPVNQPPMAHRLQPSKKRKICRVGFCPGAANQQAATPPTPSPAITSVPEFQLPEQAQKHAIAKPAAFPTPEAMATNHDSQKPTDLLSQHPFKSNKNVSHSGTRVRPLSRRPEPAKPAVTTNGRLKSNRPPTRPEDPITPKPTPVVHPELPVVANDAVPHVEDSVAPHHVDDATAHKNGLSSLFPKWNLNRQSFLASKKNVTVKTHDVPAPKVTVIPSRVPTRTTTASPKRVSIFRSVRPNSTYPTRHEAPLLSPQIGKMKAFKEKSVADTEEHQTVSKPLNVARNKANGRRNQVSAAVNNAPSEETKTTPPPSKRRVIFNTAGRTQGIRRKLVRANNENNSTQPSEQSNPVPEVVSAVTESTTTTTMELPTSTTTTPSTTTSPTRTTTTTLGTTTTTQGTTTPEPTTTVPSTVPTTTTTTESPSTTTVPSTIPTTSATTTTTAKKLEPVKIKTSVSQVVHVRSESRRAQRVKQPRAQANRPSGDTVKRHTDAVQDRLPKAIDLFELFDSTTVTSTEEIPSSTKMSFVEQEANSLDNAKPEILIVQAPKRRPSPIKDQEAGESNNELGMTSVPSTTDSTITTTTVKPSTSSTPPATTSSTTAKPSTETPTSHQTTSTAVPTTSSTNPSVKTTKVPTTTSTSTSTTEKPASSTVPTSTAKVTTNLVTVPSHSSTVTAKMVKEKAKAPFPFDIVTTEPTKEHKVPIISKKSAVASNQHSTTTRSTTLFTEKTKATAPSTPSSTPSSTTPSTTPATEATTPLSPKAGFLEMIRNAVFHKAEDKPVGRSGSYSNISIFRPSLLG